MSRVLCEKCKKNLARRQMCGRCGHFNILPCAQCKSGRVEACQKCGTALK